jgi:membrane protein DedA with SNARE-associated domain
MIGDMIADIMWYWIGYFGGMKFVDRFGKYFGITRHRIEIVSLFYHKYHERILFISKITTGFGFALITLITAGLVKIPFKKYFILNFLGGFIWAGLLMSLGYTFQHLYVTIDNILGRITIIGVSALLIILIINIGIRIRNKIEKT